MLKKYTLYLVLIIAFAIMLYSPVGVFALENNDIDSNIISTDIARYYKDSFQDITIEKVFEESVSKISINNSLLDPIYYDIETNYISLKSSYLDTLETGEYQINIYYDNNFDTNSNLLIDTFNFVVEDKVVEDKYNQIQNNIVAIISNPIFIDQMESIIYERNDNNEYILDNAILSEIYNLLNNAGIDYESLGYSFDADFLSNNIFNYSGFVKLFKNGNLVDSIETSVVFNNTNSHLDEETIYVDEFIQNNEFNFEKEVLLEEYDDSIFNIEDAVNNISSKYNIVCKSTMFPKSDTIKDLSFACFYDNKLYGFLTANLDIVIKVIVPANINNDQDYALNIVREYFINYYNRRGVNNYITNDTDLFFYGDYIGNESLTLGKFRLEKKTKYNTNSDIISDLDNTNLHNNNYYYEKDYVNSNFKNSVKSKVNNSDNTSAKVKKKTSKSLKKATKEKKSTKTTKKTSKSENNNRKNGGESESSSNNSSKTTEKIDSNDKSNIGIPTKILLITIVSISFIGVLLFSLKNK